VYSAGYEQNDYADENDIPLMERLKVNTSDNLEPIPPVLLRKYIGYTRRYSDPVLVPTPFLLMLFFG